MSDNAKLDVHVCRAPCTPACRRCCSPHCTCGTCVSCLHISRCTLTFLLFLHVGHAQANLPTARNLVARLRGLPIQVSRDRRMRASCAYRSIAGGSLFNPCTIAESEVHACRTWRGVMIMQATRRHPLQQRRWTWQQLQPMRAQLLCLPHAAAATSWQSRSWLQAHELEAAWQVSGVAKLF